MGYRLSKIYTKTGDKGMTGLGDGTRVSKDSIRVAAYGSIDELNSCLGILNALPEIPDNIRIILTNIQNDLFDVGGELSIPAAQHITNQYVEKLENILDEFNKDLPPLKEFILPGGNQAAATCHLARAICRRAEREVVTLMNQEKINNISLIYLNRLSDLLFVLARVLTRQHGNEEILWQRGENNV